MKLTKNKLKEIIREEVQKLNEGTTKDWKYWIEYANPARGDIYITDWVLGKDYKGEVENAIGNWESLSDTPLNDKGVKWLYKHAGKFAKAFGMFHGGIASAMIAQDAGADMFDES